MGDTGILSPQATDEELLLTYRATRDEALFAELVYRYEKELYSFLCRLLNGNTQMAEDVFQATFLKVHLKCDLFEKGRKLRPWLYRMAHNQAIDALRRNARHCLPSLEEPWSGGYRELSLRDALPAGDRPVGRRLEHEEALARVRSSLEQLPPPLRDAVQLVYLQGLRYRDAAAKLGVPMGTLKSRLNTALKLFRRRCLA